MTHDDAFLQAIIDSPDDDTPRLIYADWLDEHGDPQRAEFIRVQIELARLHENDTRWEQLKVSEAAFLTKHQEEWAGPLRALAEDWEFRRGFLEVVTLPTDDFLQQSEAIFRTAPVREIQLRRAEGMIGSLAACPYLGRLTALDLGGSLIGADGPQPLRPLLSSPYLGRLRKLGLGGTAIGPADLQDILERQHLFSKLAELDLSADHLGSEDIAALAASPLSDRLRDLDLSKNSLGDAGVVALASGGRFRALNRLGLSWNGIGVRGVRALTRSRFWSILVDIDLSFNPITDAGAQALLGVPRPARLASLSLGGANLSEPIRRALQEGFGTSVSCSFG